MKKVFMIALLAGRGPLGKRKLSHAKPVFCTNSYLAAYPFQYTYKQCYYYSLF